MDGPIDDHTKYSKSEKEKHHCCIIITYILNSENVMLPSLFFLLKMLWLFRVFCGSTQS